LQAVGVIGVALVVAIVIWLFQRRHNEDFGGGAAKGLSSSFWWSTVAMTQASTGDFGPRTLPGRILAIVWMVASIIAVVIFTAGVTSALTTRAMEGTVHDEGDLASVRVGALKNSSTIGYLDSQRIRHTSFTTPQDGLKALVAGRIDAFIYDKPLLSWIVKQDFAIAVNVLDTTFDEQSYAVAMPYGSTLRKPVNLALARSVKRQLVEAEAVRIWGQVVPRHATGPPGVKHQLLHLLDAGAARELDQRPQVGSPLTHVGKVLVRAAMQVRRGPA
jgi:hypothetical protein